MIINSYQNKYHLTR